MPEDQGAPAAPSSELEQAVRSVATEMAAPAAPSSELEQAARSVAMEMAALMEKQDSRRLTATMAVQLHLGGLPLEPAVIRARQLLELIDTTEGLSAEETATLWRAAETAAAE